MAKTKARLVNALPEVADAFGQRSFEDDSVFLFSIIMTILGMVLSGEKFDAEGAASDLKLMENNLRLRFPHLLTPTEEQE